MNRIAANPLLMLIPIEAIPALMVLLMMIGGGLIAIGFRRAGWSAVISAIAIPVILAIVGALFESFFEALPDALVLPVGWLISAIFYLGLIWVLFQFMFGQKAIDQAKGQLLADGVKALLRLMFRWPVFLVWGGATAYLAWKVSSLFAAAW